MHAGYGRTGQVLLLSTSGEQIEGCSLVGLGRTVETTRMMRLKGTFLTALMMAMSTSLPLVAEEGASSIDIAEREEINPGLPPPLVTMKRATVAEAWQSLLEACTEQRYEVGAHLLDLTEIRRAEQAHLGRELTEKLCHVLKDRSVRQSPVDALADAMARGDNTVVAARLEHRGVAGEVWLRRTRDLSTGEVAWLLTRRTVSSIPLWHAVVVEGRSVHDARPLNPGLGSPPVGLKRSTPRDAVTSFLTLARRGDFAAAAHLLDLSDVSMEEQGEVGALAARRLMLVMVRRGWVRPSQVSNDPAGAPEQGVAEDRELLATVELHGREVELALQRRLDPEQGASWIFAADTVAEIPAIYRSHGYGVIGDHLPLVFFSVTFGGLQLWQWLALLVTVVLAWIVGWGTGHWVVAVLRVLAQRTASSWDDLAVHTLDGPLSVVVWGGLLSLTAPWVGLDAASFKVTHTMFRLLVLVGLGWLLFRVVDAVTAHMRRAAGEANTLVLGFIPILTKVSKVLVVVLGVLAALDTVGVNVMALLAGLGLGGLAVAFAAQRTIENLFGAVAIAGDRPFTVGDFVTIGDVTGTVEDVGLRSTRLRTLQRTLVSIPNSAVMNEKVINLSARDRILYNPTIGLVYGTTVEQLMFVIDEIRKLLLTHPRVFQETQRVRFRGFGAYSLDIEVMAWVLTRDWGEYTAIAEELNFAVARIVESSGSSFAFPSQTLYLGRDAGLNATKAQEIAREVARRQAAGELAVPEPSDRLRAALYPQDNRNGDGG